MYLISTLLLALAVLGGSIADINIATDANYCPSCVGNKYLDPVNNATGCCPVGYSFQGCVKNPSGPPTTTNPTCPADDKKAYITNGRTFTIACEVVYAGAADKGVHGVSSAAECAEKCAADASCSGSNYWNKACYIYSAAATNQGTTPLAGGIKFTESSPSTTPTMSSSESCPALGDNQQIKRTQGGVTFGFSCGKYINGSPLTTLGGGPHIVANLQACVQECAALSGCRGLHFGLSSASPASRVNECNLFGGSGAQTANGVDPAWVFAMAIGR